MLTVINATERMMYNDKKVLQIKKKHGKSLSESMSI